MTPRILDKGQSTCIQKEAGARKKIRHRDRACRVSVHTAAAGGRRCWGALHADYRGRQTERRVRETIRTHIEIHPTQSKHADFQFKEGEREKVLKLHILYNKAK